MCLLFQSVESLWKETRQSDRKLLLPNLLWENYSICIIISNYMYTKYCLAWVFSVFLLFFL